MPTADPTSTVKPRRGWGLRLFDVLLVVTLLGCGFGAWRNTWTTPGHVVDNVPKNVRSNPGSYRTHYRHIVTRGGK